MTNTPQQAKSSRPARVVPRLIAVMSLVVLMAACIRDNPVMTPPPGGIPEPGTPDPQAEGTACPVDGCSATILTVEREGDELVLTFDANFDPGVSRNHFHVFWDTFEPAQVSDNAEPVHGVAQGSWEPTPDNPYTTEGAASLSERGDSTNICVTPGDRDHNVVDPEVVDCQDISSLL